MNTRFEAEKTEEQRQHKGANSLKDGSAQNVTNSSGKGHISKSVLPQPVVDTATVQHPITFSTPHTSNIRAPEWWQRLSLRTKATIMAIALSTLPVIALGTTAYYLTDKSITESVTDQQQARVISLATQLNRFILEGYRDIQTLSRLGIISDTRLREVTSLREKQALLEQYIKNNEGYDSIIVTDLNGNVILQSTGGVIANYDEIDYFQQVIKTNRPVITPPRKSLATGEYSIFFAAPVVDTATGRTIGMVRSRTPLRYFNDALQTEAKELAQNIQGFGSAEYFALNNVGKVVVAPTPHVNYIGKDVQSIFPRAATKLRAANAVGSVMDVNRLEQEEYLLSYVPVRQMQGLPELKWSAMVAQPTAEIFAARRGLMLTFAIGTGVKVLLVAAIASLLINRALRPLINASTAVKKLGQGQLNTRIPVKGQDEVAVLGSNFNLMVDQLQTLLRNQEAEAERVQILADIAMRIRQSLNLEDILQTAVREVRRALHADRVVIYQFNADLSGTVVAESVTPGWTQAIGEKLDDPCFRDRYAQLYEDGRVRGIDNIYQAGLNDCFISTLERFEVKATLIAPILKDNQLLGLLIAHQCSEPRAWQQFEIDLFTQTAIQIGFAIDQANLLERQKAEAKRAQLFNYITLRIRQSLNLEDILKTSVKEVRQALHPDRVVIYRFDSEWKGIVVAESVAPGWTQALNEQIYDPCFKEHHLELYRNGRVRATNNIYQAGLTDCHISTLERFEVKANLVAPILKGKQLLGLLIAHQCSEPRAWQQTEIDLFTQLATQIGFALDQANLLEQVEKARREAETISQEQRQQKEALQRQLVELLSEVEEASTGNLTVRAEVTVGEIGTVADFFNAIIESLRQIVTQVKKAADQVNVAVGENEGAMRQLADEALGQAEEITRTLDSVEQMTLSIQAVADSAQLAAEVATTASTTAESGGEAMDRTVHSILSLRETVAQTANKVRRLGESSQQITRVVTLIHQLALQTNVLAINASIEATRAGEEGRGFAVVAEEVGELAAKSAAATKEIEQVVEDIQRETSEVVRAMELGNTQVVEGAYLVEDTKKSLEKILDVSRQIDHLVQSISVATVSQAQTSQAVTHLMKEIAKVSERTWDSSRHVSSSLQKTIEVAQQLQASVSAFKVDAES